MQLPYGLHWGLVPGIKAAWGARAIISQDGMVDLLHDRQGADGEEPLVKKTMDWLNGPSKPIKAARELASSLLTNYEMTTKDETGYILYQDREGAIIASPNGSCGYLYISAYLFEALPDGHPTRGLEIVMEKTRNG